ncbi:LysR family transcriptional regulator [Pokkaliibacter plantistimulans]|uniref:LysR family transcriptional regulator n=1 Tax=Proteobacteria bacterium 228 TaxID=2083153 RepID=A0A2S5KKJ1_9PROT|nr:LysR substrate-binding domain-containing protein [Pokkaliibacter plantistimulans]PPC75250.1 LysR family transcriptional regulator [Pokkaliibacter plantistimulans]
MARRLPPLNALRAFVVAARHQSFTRAADELCVTHGAVSRQIATLEQHLGVAVFARTPQGVVLTDKGKVLLQGCAQAFALLHDSVDAVTTPSLSSVLVLSCEPTLAMRWLIPRLDDFQQQYPDIQLSLLTAGGVPDWQRGGVDLALRRNDFPLAAGTVVQRLAAEMTGPVCAAGLDETQPQCQLHAATRPQAWADWLAQCDSAPPFSGQQRQFEHFYLTLQAAAAGQGLAMASLYMVADEVQQGRLQAPWGFRADGSEYVLLAPQALAAGSPQQLFAGWLQGQMQQTLAQLTALGSN